MLHEILLSLSGQPSPLLNLGPEEDSFSQDAFPLISPPEKSLLVSIARLSRLHARLRNHSSIISSSHPSVICRAVSTAIISEHLGGFQKKVLEVEKAILVEDSGYVGGYGIVPLSTIVGEFAPWTRRLEWLWEIVAFIQPERKGNGSPRDCTGAALIDHLREESQTGYVDIEEMARHLVTAAESAWMRQLSMWLLCGNLPAFGKNDFFVQEDVEGGHAHGMAHFTMRSDLLPKFVSPHTASSILFIGKSLNHIRAKGNIPTEGTSNGPLTSPVTLHGEHIEHLSALKPPISTLKLSSAVSAIRLSLSRSLLSRLLPLPKILEILSLLHDFLLLRRGEFAMALVSHADARLNERHLRPGYGGTGSEGLDGLLIKEGDVIATLVQSFTELYSLQNEEDPVDDELDLARDILRLSIDDRRNDRSTGAPEDLAGINLVPGISEVSFDDLLFPTPTSLSVQVHPPLDLFLSSADVSVYSKIHSYLLGIRRAQIRLGDLWKRTSLRKCYPTPWGPPRSSTPFGQSKLKMGRERDNIRIRQMRAIWATCSASLFVLSEIGSFFQGEVVNRSWEHFREWIGGAPSPTASVAGSRPGTASSMKQKGDRNTPFTEKTPTDHNHSTEAHDPETLTVAHRRHLSSLIQYLFLSHSPFTKSLRLLLTSVDRFMALVIRLENIQHNMDLETDEGVVDDLADYPGEERKIWRQLAATRGEVESRIKDVIDRLREIDDSRSGEGQKIFDLVNHADPNLASLQNGPNTCNYIPRKAAGVDRLLMKLDFGNFNDTIDPGPAPGGYTEMN